MKAFKKASHRKTDDMRLDAARFIAEFIGRQALPLEQHQRYMIALEVLMGNQVVIAQVRKNTEAIRKAQTAQ